jgi:hypothetical protein
MMPSESLKLRLLEATSHHPVPARKDRRPATAAVLALSAGATLATYAAMLALGSLWTGGGVAGAVRAASSGVMAVLQLGTATAGRPGTSGGWIVVGTLVLATAATSLALPSRRSMLSPPRGRLLAVAIGAPLLVGAWLMIWGTTYADPFVRFGWRCLVLTAGTAPWPFLALYRASHRLDPQHPRLTGAALGSAAGVWGAVLAESWCPLTAADHVLVGHVLPLVFLAAVGAGIGYRMFRLRRLVAYRLM